ncbi:MULTISPECIES: hypothetical protein [Streptomyces]|uniref:TetR family transcriptional regulator n=2 Tax=Streptomyces TaxID=1883 RepID=A0ABV9IMC9_9ACTN
MRRHLAQYFFGLVSLSGRSCTDDDVEEALVQCQGHAQAIVDAFS